MKELPLLTEQQTFVLMRLFNEPQRRQGPIARELAALKLVILRENWVSLSPMGRRAVRETKKAVTLFEDTY